MENLEKVWKHLHICKDNIITFMNQFEKKKILKQSRAVLTFDKFILTKFNQITRSKIQAAQLKFSEKKSILEKQIFGVLTKISSQLRTMWFSVIKECSTEEKSMIASNSKAQEAIKGFQKILHPSQDH